MKNGSSALPLVSEVIVAVTDAASTFDKPAAPSLRPTAPMLRLMERARAGEALGEDELTQLFSARGDDCQHLLQLADEARAESCGDTVSYVVNRNINYTSSFWKAIHLSCAAPHGPSTNFRRRISIRIQFYERALPQNCFQDH